jgi:hypothetical protein
MNNQTWDRIMLQCAMLIVKNMFRNKIMVSGVPAMAGFRCQERQISDMAHLPLLS